MKIRLIHLFSLACILLLFSCKSAPKHAEIIPEDAQMVASIHVGQMLEKADMERVQELENLMEQLRKNMDDDMQELFDQLVEDPASSGIDFSKPFFTFNYSKGKRFDDNYQSYTIFSFAISDREKFQEMLDVVIEDPEFEEEEDYTWCYTSEEKKYAELVAFGDDYGIYMDPSGYRMENDDKERELDRIMTMESESSLMEYSDNFADFAKNGADIAYWLSSESMVDNADRELDRLEEGFESLGTDFPFDRADLENNFVTGEINFENGKITLATKVALSDALKEFYKEVEGDDLNTDHIGLIPGEELIGIYAISMNMEGVKDKLEEWEMNELIDEAATAEFGLDYEELMTTFSGAMFMGASGEVEMKMKSYSGESRTETTPGFYVGIGVSDEKSLDKVLDELEGLELPGMKIEQVEEYYEIEANRYLVYMAAIDDLLIISNDQDWIEEAIADEVENGLSDDVLDHFDGVPAAAYLNLDTESWPNSLAGEMGRALGFFGRGNDDKFESFMDLFDHIHMKGDINENEMVMKLTTEEDNSLFAILQIIDENLD